MTKPRRNHNRTEQLVLSDTAIRQIADELERRMRNLLRPEPTPIPTLIDPDDLMTPQQAAHRFGVSDQTIYRWIQRFNIGECIAGTVLISRRKLDGHLAHRRSRAGI